MYGTLIFLFFLTSLAFLWALRRNGGIVNLATNKQYVRYRRLIWIGAIAFGLVYLAVHYLLFDRYIRITGIWDFICQGKGHIWHVAPLLAIFGYFFALEGINRWKKKRNRIVGQKMPSKKQKLYAYVDESGQDTKGRFFVVGIIVTEENRDRIIKELEAIEQDSGKNNVKWHSARPHYREKYLTLIAQSSLLKNQAFFDTFTNSKQYIEMSSFVTARAILRKAKEDYSASIFVDGFNKRELEKFERGLKELRIKKRKLRGVRRDENNALIRFADAICGLIRDVEDGNETAIALLKQLVRKSIVIAL